MLHPCETFFPRHVQCIFQVPFLVIIDIGIFHSIYLNIFRLWTYQCIVWTQTASSCEAYRKPFQLSAGIKQSYYLHSQA